jgi:hypothetical protein
MSPLHKMSESFAFLQQPKICTIIFIYLTICTFLRPHRSRQTIGEESPTATSQSMRESTVVPLSPVVREQKEISPIFTSKYGSSSSTSGKFSTLECVEISKFEDILKSIRQSYKINLVL